jgi:selenocysteine lyase/cysteine desulfurase
VSSTSTLTRRSFTRLLTGGAAAALAPMYGGRELSGDGSSLDYRWSSRPLSPLPSPAAPRDEPFWQAVRDQFVMPPDLACLNAANLCPSSRPVLEKLYEVTRDVDRDPSQNNRRKLTDGKEAARKIIADFLHASPEEIVLARNTSEANNIVSSGIDLKAGDEIVILSDNHPSNHKAWTDKAARFGFTVRTVNQVNPHPGGEYYLDAFVKASSARTRLWALTHLTNTVGDLLPVAELCRAARERGILTLVDGAQTLGLLDLDLPALGCDFFSGSGHKWPCGPRETGVLYVARAAQATVAPSVISLYPGAVGASRTLEAYGQRDEAAIIALGEAVTFQMKIGPQAIAERSRELAVRLMDGLKAIPGVKIWTHPAPDRSWAVVSFQPGALDPRKLSDVLYEKDRIACAPRSNVDRPGLRFSPHFYNLASEVDRTVAAVAKYAKSGLA